MAKYKKYSLKISKNEIKKLKNFVKDTILLLENLPYEEIDVSLEEFRIQEQKNS